MVVLEVLETQYGTSFCPRMGSVIGSALLGYRKTFMLNKKDTVVGRFCLTCFSDGSVVEALTECLETPSVV